MVTRSWYALLLLVSYLLIAGTGRIQSPSEPRYATSTSFAHQVHHHQDRYADFDELELGLDGLSTVAISAAENQPLPTERQVVLGIDAHCLPAIRRFSFLSGIRSGLPKGVYSVLALPNGHQAINAPPW